MANLSRLSLSGFRSIRSLRDLEFGQLNVLIGANGAGKSNLISLFRMLNAIALGGLTDYVARAGYADSVVFGGVKTTETLEAELTFEVRPGAYSYHCILEANATGFMYFSQEEVGWLDKKTGEGHSSSIVARPDESGLNEAGGVNLTARAVSRILGSTLVYQFHDTSSTSRVRGKSQVDDNRALSEDGGNLAAMLYYTRLIKPEVYARIVETIRQAAPFFADFVLEPDRLNEKYISLRWRSRDGNHEFGPHQLSDGTLRFMALVTLLSLPVDPSQSIIFIDEPELGLHPAAITLLADLLRVASTSSQVIVSTQSVTLVDQFEAEDIIVAERADGQSVYRRLDPSALAGWLEDYSLGTLWEKNVLGGRP